MGNTWRALPLLLVGAVALAGEDPAGPQVAPDEGEDHVVEAVRDALAHTAVPFDDCLVRDVEMWAARGPALREDGRVRADANLPGERHPLRPPVIDRFLREPAAALQAASRLPSLVAERDPSQALSVLGLVEADAAPRASVDGLRRRPVAWWPVVERAARTLAALEDLWEGRGAQTEDPDRLLGWMLDGIDSDDIGAARTEMERLAAGRSLYAAARARRLVQGLAEAVRGAPTEGWPTEPLTVQTGRGTIVVGTTAGETHVLAEDAAPPWLLVDPGGDDRYEGGFGGARGTATMVLDLGGGDLYTTEGAVSQGAALAGVGVLVDLDGDDRYEGGDLCQGAAVCGIGVLLDLGGIDSFRGGRFAQGAGAFGLGYMESRGGGDAYFVEGYGQGLGRTGGYGVLVDTDGSDRYEVGTSFESMYSEWTGGTKVHWSFAQGCGFGVYGRYEEPDTSEGAGAKEGATRLVIHETIPGGVGVLLDREGDDRYVGSMYAQGTAYFYGLGVLVDAAGDDAYTSTWYGQGAAPHFAVGMLVDGGGHDRYEGMNQVQGNARDFSRALLLDVSGDDLYDARDRAQGCGDLNDSYGYCIDLAGSDRYVAGRKTCRGFATDTARKGAGTEERPYTDVGVFIDLGGDDVYEGPARGKNGTTWTHQATERGVGIDR